MTSDAVVRARIDERTKNLAAEILEASGLTTSSAIRMLMIRIVEDGGLPFEPHRPNKQTLKSMAEGKAHKVTRAKNGKDLIKKLNA